MRKVRSVLIFGMALFCFGLFWAPSALCQELEPGLENLSADELEQQGFEQGTPGGQIHFKADPNMVRSMLGKGGILMIPDSTTDTATARHKPRRATRFLKAAVAWRRRRGRVGSPFPRTGRMASTATVRSSPTRLPEPPGRW